MENGEPVASISQPGPPPEAGRRDILRDFLRNISGALLAAAGAAPN